MKLFTLAAFQKKFYPSTRLDRAGDRGEHGADLGAEGRDSDQANNRDQGQQQAVLGQRRAFFFPCNVLGDELLRGGDKVLHGFS